MMMIDHTDDGSGPGILAAALCTDGFPVTEAVTKEVRTSTCINLVLPPPGARTDAARITPVHSIPGLFNCINIDSHALRLQRQPQAPAREALGSPNVTGPDPECCQWSKCEYMYFRSSGLTHRHVCWILHCPFFYEYF